MKSIIKKVRENLYLQSIPDDSIDGGFEVREISLRAGYEHIVSLVSGQVLYKTRDKVLQHLNSAFNQHENSE